MLETIRIRNRKSTDDDRRTDRTIGLLFAELIFVIPMSAVAASSEGSRALLALYKRLLRSCATYPSKNRWGIYESIREEFRENMALDPNDPQTREKIGIAYKGLEQLRMYDEAVLGGGTGENPNWSVTLEQNPMPAPPEQK